MSNDNQMENVDELFKDLPAEDRKTVQHILTMSMQMAQVSTPQAELMKKITSENISEITNLQDKELDLAYRESKDAKNNVCCHACGCNHSFVWDNNIIKR